MNTYSVNDSAGATVGTVQADDVDTALSNARFLYGPDVTVTRQFTTKALGIDPLWILLGLLLVARLMSHKRSQKVF